jgi:isoquinoline 1-oxidoreductase beta subunit
MRAGWYRPLYLHRLRAGLDADGKPVAWEHRIVGQSIITGTAFEQALVVDEIDQTSVEGANNLPYAIPNLLCDLHSPTLPCRCNGGARWARPTPPSPSSA